MRELFVRYYPHAFVVAAHLVGVSIAFWMDRYDLVAAGIAFGIPSTLLFLDILPGGKNRMASFIGKLIR